MSFQVGDIVWVPSSTAPGKGSSIKCEYWPAKVHPNQYQFIKQTNRADICIVSLFKANANNEPDEQFIVDTEEILRFQSYQPLDTEPQFIPAYEHAKKEFKQRAKKKQHMEQEYIISNSLQFCQFIDKLMFANFIPLSVKAKEDKITLIPKFNSGGLPLGMKDLHLYFQRRIPQIISFLLECEVINEKEELIKFLKESKEKINISIIKGLKNRSINLRTQ